MLAALFFVNLFFLAGGAGGKRISAFWRWLGTIHRWLDAEWLRERQPTWEATTFSLDVVRQSRHPHTGFLRLASASQAVQNRAKASGRRQDHFVAGLVREGSL